MSEHIRARLEKNFPLDEEGDWEIRGEDPNCDMGGIHHSPKLGAVHGRYKDIIEYALTLKGFVAWGYGGDIFKVHHSKIKTIPKGFTQESLTDLYKRKEILTKELAELELKISNLDIDYE